MLPAPLLPKLQGHFAEFLSHDSLEHLRILSSTTCVGLRYGQLYCKRLAGFLGSLIRVIISVAEALEYYHVSARPADVPTGPIPTPFNDLFRQIAAVSLLRHHIAVIKSMGILTHYPSASPFGYTLGPD